MKRNISLFLFLLLILPCACTQRPQPTDNPGNDIQESIVWDPAEDSLICEVGEALLLHYQEKHDTAAALNWLPTLDSLVCSLYGEEKMKPNYYVMAQMYNYYNQPQACFDWLHKARPAKPALLHTWYNQLAGYSLRFGQYADALAYADSCLTTMSGKSLNASRPSLIKGQALLKLGRTDEAGRWYASSVARIDKLFTAREKKKYSHYELRIFYDYAFILHQAKRHREAIPLLTRVWESKDYQSLPDTATTYHIIDIETPPIDAARLLAQSYYSIGQKDHYPGYMHQVDSLQEAANEARWKTEKLRLEEMLQNKELSNQLLLQKEQTASARRMQYLLLTLVVILAASLLAAVLWWRHHRRRLRRLFMLIALRHADWLEIRSLLMGSSLPMANEPAYPQEHLQLTPTPPTLPAEPESTPATDEETPPTVNQQQVYRRIFHQALRVMETDKPFLDPQFDLITLARLVGTNRTQLSTAINRHAQTTFSNWLATYRVNYLIQQINEQPDLYIDELYHTAGFASRTSFYRQFRQATGMTPKQYMKERNR